MAKAPVKRPTYNRCQALTQTGGQCRRRAFSEAIPLCKQHIVAAYITLKATETTSKTTVYVCHEPGEEWSEEWP